MLQECVTVSKACVTTQPNKRVNYTFGMVLGVSDFCQEQRHLEWKQQLGNRLLHGYGTVSGLGVSLEDVTNPADVQVRVAPGYALSPQGRWMWLDDALCADEQTPAGSTAAITAGSLQTRPRANSQSILPKGGAGVPSGRERWVVASMTLHDSQS